jgi:hypothetical protein
MALIWELLNIFKKRMRISPFLFLFAFVFLFYSAFPQKSSDDFTILFYNTENLFDTKDEPQKEDDEFTPAGERHWTNKKLHQKLVNLSKVILNSAGFEMPGVVATCEIENREVLERLLTSTPLKGFNYKIIHKESPDHRGIDAALLYDADRIYPLEFNFYALQKGEEIVKTREILYFSGKINNDTLHFFINHWPSRYEGLLESKPMRNSAAKLLKQKIKELQQKVHHPKIIILGDFNDQPTDESLFEILGAQSVSEKVQNNQLYNLSIPWMKAGVQTQKYQSQWSVFDQCVVSGALINSKAGYSVIPENAKITELPFLLKKDEKYGGMKPFRTYNGYSYEGGFSDHLPIQVQLNLQN